LRKGLLAFGCLLVLGCSAYEARHEARWNAEDQIWLAEESQVKVRAAQSRVLETADRRRTLEAVVAAFQDIGCQVEVLDEELGIVSGSKLVETEKPSSADPTYSLYDESDLLAFTKSARTWGPFRHRSNLVRLTVTVRKRNEQQLVVRAAAQFYLRPVEEPETYQKFFRTLEQALFVDRQMAGGDRP
jgi:hypothetical protein